MTYGLTQIGDASDAGFDHAGCTERGADSAVRAKPARGGKLVRDQLARFFAATEASEGDSGSRTAVRSGRIDEPDAGNHLVSGEQIFDPCFGLALRESEMPAGPDQREQRPHVGDLLFHAAVGERVASAVRVASLE